MEATVEEQKANRELAEMICNAHRFYMCAQAIYNAEQEGKNFAAVYPVNESFSIELMFKAILRYDRKEQPPSTHNLRKLYNCLSNKTRREVLAVLNADEENITQIQLEEILDASADAFELFRYVYEEKKGEDNQENVRFGYQPLQPLFGALLEYLKERIPEVVAKGLACEGINREWEKRTPESFSTFAADVITQPAKYRKK